MYNIPGLTDAPADQLHRVPPPDWTDHQLGRPCAQAKWRQCQRNICPTWPSSRLPRAIRPVPTSCSRSTASTSSPPCGPSTPRTWPDPRRRAACRSTADDSRSNWEAPGNGLRRAVDIGGGLQHRQHAGRHRAGPGELRHRLRVSRELTRPESGRRGAERQRQVHPADAGGRRLGPRLRHPAVRRHPRAQLQRIGPQRLQPLDLQLPADTDQGMDHRQGGHDEPVRQLRPHSRSTGGTRNSDTPVWACRSSAMASIRSSPMFRARSTRPRQRARPTRAAT